MAEHGNGPISLEQAVRAGGMAHRAERYPGDLAAELGLGGAADAEAERGWLMRWRPALALCAVLAVAAGVVLVVVGIRPAPPAPPITDVKPSTPVHPAAPVDPGPVYVEHAPAPSLLDMPPAEYAQAKQKVRETAAHARQHANAYWSAQWLGQTSPPPPSVHGSGMAISLGSMPALRLPPLTLPSGTRLPSASLPTL